MYRQIGKTCKYTTKSYRKYIILLLIDYFKKSWLYMSHPILSILKVSDVIKSSVVPVDISTGGSGNELLLYMNQNKAVCIVIITNNT